MTSPKPFPHFGAPEHYQPAPEPPAPVENSGIGKAEAVAPKSDAARAADALERIAAALESVVDHGAPLEPAMPAAVRTYAVPPMPPTKRGHQDL